MERTWRWFGKKDKITLAQLRQIGVEGIVTALHDVPLGQVWTREKIRDLREYIESYGMRWSVVESLPVVETIKYGGPDRDEQIEVYKQSLRNLAAEGIHTICYNFMPVLDWARTDLLHTNPNGSTNLYFNYAEFAYFDIYILKREGAREEWSRTPSPSPTGEGRDILAECDELAKTMTPEKEHKLVENIIIKTQGFVSGNFSENDAAPIQKFRDFLELYKGIDKKQLRENMKYFLEAIMPTCDECDMNMCVHPDDPPIEILGLSVPRRTYGGSSTLCPIPTTASRSVPEACRQELITTWLTWPASLPAAPTSCICARATSSPTATSPKPATWADVPTSLSFAAYLKRKNMPKANTQHLTPNTQHLTPNAQPVCPCAWITA